MPRAIAHPNTTRTAGSHPHPPPPSPPDPPIEPGAGLTEIETQALSVANYILEQLEDSNPDYESLKQDVKELGKNKGLIQNKDVVERIETVEQTFKKAYQRHERHQDSIGSLTPGGEGPGSDPHQEEPENRSNLWMFIGAALLAILMFVGNQVMQSIRAKKNQVSMAKAQQEAMKKAQEMARQQQQQMQQQANGNTPDPNKKRYTI